jgi:hypothetical protein
MLMTFMLPFLVIPLVGLAIDASVCRLVELRLQAAVDGAATGSGRLLGVVTDNVVQNVASEFLKSNFTTGGGSWGAYNLSSVQGTDIVYTPGITKKIFVKARVTVPLLFLRMLGFPNVLVAAVGQATRTDSRVMFVLDRSGSMGPPPTGSNVIVNAIANAQTFVGGFREGTDELGLVVFDGSAVVGYPTYAAGGWTTAISLASTGGPNTTFQDGTANDMLHQLSAVTANSATGMAEAIWLAYIEIQKAHMRDLANPVNKGTDTRTNTIVLLTDGVPTAVSLYLNDPRLVGGVPNANDMVATTACTNKTILLTQQNNLHMMLGWFAIGGSPTYSNGQGTLGVDLLASTDTAHSSNWWISNNNSNTAQDVANPGSTGPGGPYQSCNSGMLNDGNSYTYFSNKIPDTDAWGNPLTGIGYRNSHIIFSSTGATTVYSSGDLVQASVGTNYDWGLAMWNSVDNAAARIRTDVNKPNRVGDTDPALKIGFEVLGYTGNGGIDDGLLKRLANDPGAVGFVPAQPNGKYYEADNTTQMSAAMNAIAADILRLSR